MHKRKVEGISYKWRSIKYHIISCAVHLLAQNKALKNYYRWFSCQYMQIFAVILQLFAVNDFYMLYDVMVFLILKHKLRN